MRLRMRTMIFVLLVFGIIISGCGGNGGTGSVDPGNGGQPPTSMPVDLSDLSAAALGTVMISEGTVITAGHTMTFGDVTFSCPAGGAACTLAQTADGVTSTGGQATAMLAQRAVDLAALSNAARGTVTIPAGTVIPAGQMLRIGDVTFTCPAGGAACTLAQSNGDVTATGGQATAALALADVNLAGLSDDARGTIAIPPGAVIRAGETKRIGDVTFSCPAGGADCTLGLTVDGGVTSTGGRATVEVAQAPVDLGEFSQAAIDKLRILPGTVIRAGETLTIGDITFSCPAGGADCTLALTADGGVASTGGLATAALALDDVNLAAFSDAARGTITIPRGGTVIRAGETRRIGDVVFTCPAAGSDCTLEQTADGQVTSTGGQATAALVQGDVVLTTLSNPVQRTIGIPQAVTIAPGESATIGDVTFTCPAGGAECTLTQDANGMVTSAGGLATAAVSQVAQDRMAGHTAAIGQSGPLNKAARPGGANLALTLAPDENGTMSYLQDRLGADDVGVVNEFQPSNLPHATIDGWTGQVFRRELPERNTEDVLTVYHDRQGDSGRQYMSFFARANAVQGQDHDARNTNDVAGDFQAINRRPAIVTGIIDYGDATNNNNPDANLNLNARTGIFDANRDGEGTLLLGGAANTAVPADEAELFSSTIFRFVPTADAPNGPTQITHPDMDEGGVRVEYGGSFHGVPGHYECHTGGGCVVLNDGQGNLGQLGPGWRFVPSIAGAMGTVANVQFDVDYLSFGYWLRTVTAADGSETYGVNTFANGSIPFGDNTNGNAEIAALQGTATYNGRATGMYAVQRFDTGDGVPSETGQFTADAELTASFGGNAVAADDQFSIRGNVTNFRDTANTPISNGEWNVALQRADFVTRDAAGAITGNTQMNVFNGNTTGGGTWTGGFFGMTAEQVDDAAVDPLELPAPPTTTYPTGVAGEFNAHLGNGHVIGAFGATRQ